MNVKMKNQNLRFKISDEELEQLLSGRCLHVTLALFGKRFVATINPAGRGETMETKLIFDDQDCYLNLLVPPFLVQEIADMGKNCEGLKQRVKGVSITLQVDMPEACHT